MRYMGGKSIISKELCKFLNLQLEPNQNFVDAFCGSLNIIRYIDNKKLRIANDLNHYLIALWKHLQDGGQLPESISQEEYKKIKNNKNQYPDWLVAFVGFGCSFAGKWFAGPAKSSIDRDYVKEAVRGCYKKSEVIKDVIFTCKSYSDLEVPKCSLIYCDIPYRNTTGYAVGEFDHDRFYQWALKKFKDGHKIFVSEYNKNIPDGWKVVWSKESKTGLKNSIGRAIATTEVLIAPINTKVFSSSLDDLF
jgi:DNA adenine methylase